MTGGAAGMTPMVEISHDELARLHVIEGAARRVVERLLDVYRPEYVERCAQEEPESLLAQVRALQDRLAAGNAGVARLSDAAPYLLAALRDMVKDWEEIADNSYGGGLEGGHRRRGEALLAEAARVDPAGVEMYRRAKAAIAKAEARA